MAFVRVVTKKVRVSGTQDERDMTTAYFAGEPYAIAKARSGKRPKHVWKRK
jgi:hypothetical protein